MNNNQKVKKQMQPNPLTFGLYDNYLIHHTISITYLSLQNEELME